MTTATLKPTKFRDVEIRAPRGSQLNAKSWLTEAPLRMLMNNLDPDVAENPKELVVYGGIGRAARNWECFDQIVASLKELNDDETLLVQSGKPVGVFKTHKDAPRVLIANSNLVPRGARISTSRNLFSFKVAVLMASSFIGLRWDLDLVNITCIDNIVQI